MLLAEATTCSIALNSNITKNLPTGLSRSLSPFFRLSVIFVSSDENKYCIDYLNVHPAIRM